jgi:hypothetical protein
MTQTGSTDRRGAAVVARALQPLPQPGRLVAGLHGWLGPGGELVDIGVEREHRAVARAAGVQVSDLRRLGYARVTVDGPFRGAMCLYVETGWRPLTGAQQARIREFVMDDIGGQHRVILEAEPEAGDVSFFARDAEDRVTLGRVLRSLNHLLRSREGARLGLVEAPVS